MYIFGQILGLLATIASIIIPLFKKKTHMLVNTIVINVLIALNFVFIGQIGSAICLYFVACIQAIVSLVHEKKNTECCFVEKIIFLCLYVGFGIIGIVTAPDFVLQFSFKNILELLPICGSIMSMMFVFVKDEQIARRYLLATASIWAVYTLIVRSSTFFAQLFSIITTLIAMYKYRNKKNQK